MNQYKTRGHKASLAFQIVGHISMNSGWQTTDSLTPIDIRLPTIKGIKPARFTMSLAVVLRPAMMATPAAFNFSSHMHTFALVCFRSLRIIVCAPCVIFFKLLAFPEASDCPSHTLLMPLSILDQLVWLRLFRRLTERAARLLSILSSTFFVLAELP